jgi:hypothetical protein
MPHIHDSSSSCWQHAVLQTIQILSVDRRYEFACHETEENSWREIVLADTVAELEVLVEHCAEGEGDRLLYLSMKWFRACKKCLP